MQTEKRYYLALSNTVDADSFGPCLNKYQKWWQYMLIEVSSKGIFLIFFTVFEVFFVSLYKFTALVTAQQRHSGWTVRNSKSNNKTYMIPNENSLCTNLPV